MHIMYIQDILGKQFCVILNLRYYFLTSPV